VAVIQFRLASKPWPTKSNLIEGFGRRLFDWLDGRARRRRDYCSQPRSSWLVLLFGPWGYLTVGVHRGGEVEGALMVQTVLPNPGMERNSACE
jgi:hypothetical protein